MGCLSSARQRKTRRAPFVDVAGVMPHAVVEVVKHGYVRPYSLRDRLWCPNITLLHHAAAGQQRGKEGLNKWLGPAGEPVRYHVYVVERRRTVLRRVRRAPGNTTACASTCHVAVHHRKAEHARAPSCCEAQCNAMHHAAKKTIARHTANC